jgi:hypothetical protein
MTALCRVQPNHPYRGLWAAVATMHGKERAIAPPLCQWFGITLTTAPTVDTDALGTFTGEVPRVGTVVEAARLKARLAIETTGADLGIGSEGAFGPHPHLPFTAAGLEVLVLCEAAGSHDIVVQRRTATNLDHISLGPLDGIETFLQRAGFPSHALVVQRDNPARTMIAKGIADAASLRAALTKAFATGDRALATTDMRAHVNPTRMSSIARLARHLALRTARLCPCCGRPGFGLVDVERGLPCRDCDQPTRRIRAEIYGCTTCGHRMQRKIRPLRLSSDPMSCEVCNP